MSKDAETTDALYPLSDRLAALDGPSREIDAEIDAVLGWRLVDNPTHAGGLIDMWHKPDGSLGRRDEALHRYTGSLDTAMTLGREGLHPYVLLRQAIDPCIIAVGHNRAAFIAALPRFVCAAAMKARGL